MTAPAAPARPSLALTILPTAAATDPALSSGALRVLIALPCSLAWAPLDVGALAAQLHKSRSSIYRAIRLLRDHHYLLRRPSTDGAHPRYVYRVNLLRYQERSA